MPGPLAVVVLLVLVACATPDRGPPFLRAVLQTADPATRAYGFDVVDATSEQLAAVDPAQRALVWLGDYDDVTCRWERSDEEVRAELAAVASRREQVAGYMLADEPDTDRRCPSAPGDLRTRAELVRAVDPDPARFTYATIDDESRFAGFADAVDVVGADPYPCRVGQPCDWRLIPATVDALRAAGVRRYVGVLQAFGDDRYRWPTAAELAHMIAQWQRSAWQGQITFAWSWAGGRLADHPDLLDVLRRLNADPRAPFALPP